MSELIKREDVCREIQTSFDLGAFRWQDGQDLMDRINALPTIDAVPVVRCKDCFNQPGCQFAQYQGNRGYCSLGERREG